LVSVQVDPASNTQSAAPPGHAMTPKQYPFLMFFVPVKPWTEVHQKFGTWQSSCFEHAGAQNPKSPAPFPLGEKAQTPFIGPPQLGVFVGSFGSPPSSQFSVQSVAVVPVKFTHTPAHSGIVAMGLHDEPCGLPVLGVSTHTARRGSQTRPIGHWLSSPHVGRQA
jgi:hypothetical protein